MRNTKKLMAVLAVTTAASVCLTACGGKETPAAQPESQAPAAAQQSAKEESYRSIVVHELDGDATVDRPGIGEMPAYANMMLQSEDNAATADNCHMQLRLDEDKYVLVEPSTEFSMVAEGNAANSKTAIHLVKGNIISRLDGKLSGDASYVVNTPNSTMAVRGTVFSVDETEDANGETHTTLSVYEGTVQCALVFPDGCIDPNPILFEAGERVNMWGTDESAGYVGEETRDEHGHDDKGNPVTEAHDKEEIVTEMDASDYEDLCNEAQTFLKECAEEGHDLYLDLEDKPEATATPTPRPTAAPTPAPVVPTPTPVPAGPFTVTFTYNGGVFATQTVNGGGTASVPKLKPAANGSWGYDFGQPVTSDITVSWND